MRRIMAMLTGAAMLAGITAAQAGESGAAVAEAFCAAVQAGDEAAAEVLMTAELQAAIAALREADAEFRKTYPGDKPPLGDGLRLAAFPDTPESCTPSEASSESVVLTYAPAGAPDAVWRDQLLLVRVGDGLRIADILYAPDGTARFSGWVADSTAWK